MPPTAKDKEANAALIASLPVRDQVDQLSQALLREFMHRKGFKKTLETFDSECPRTERTVSSRLIMKKLLNIPVEGRPSRLVAGKGGAPTFMEELCSYRLTKRGYALRRKQHREQSRINSDAAADTNGDDGDAAELEDPSDVELSALASQAQAREAAAAEAAEVLAEYQSLVAVREKRLSKKATKRKGVRGKRSMDTSEGPSSGDSSDSDADATGSRLRAHSRAQTLTKALDAFAFHSEEGALAMPSSVPRANATSDWTALGGVGSSWSPPGAATARPTASDKLEGNDPFTPFHFPGDRPHASLPDRRSFLAGDGMTRGGGGEPRTSLRREEILDTWRPGGSGTARGGAGLLGGGNRTRSSPVRPFRMPGGGGSAEPPSVHRHKSSFISSEDPFKHPAGRPSVYDPSAQPHASALAQNSSSSSLLSGTDHGRRQGIGFRRTSDPSVARTKRRVKLLVD